MADNNSNSTTTNTLSRVVVLFSLKRFLISMLANIKLFAKATSIILMSLQSLLIAISPFLYIELIIEDEYYLQYSKNYTY